MTTPDVELLIERLVLPAMGHSDQRAAEQLEHLHADRPGGADCARAGGYGGFGRDIAFPFRTPPEMVLGIDPGLAFDRFEFEGPGGG